MRLAHEIKGSYDGRDRELREVITWTADGGCTLIYGCILTFEGQVDATMVSKLSVTMPSAEVVEQLKRALLKPRTAASNVAIMQQRPKTAASNVVIMRRRRR